jgi:hypothetical protein
MKIKIQEGFPEMANLGISTIAVVLNELFGKYDQYTEPEEAEKVSTGLISMPIVAYEPRRINLKTTAIKNTHLDARFAVYSKKEEETKECLRFILKKRHITKEEFLKQLPAMIQQGALDTEGQYQFIDFIHKLSGIPADNIQYFYNPVTCEGYVMHCMAIIHEFGKEDNVYCTATTYMSIQVNK